MARGLDATLTTAVGEVSTQPYYLVKLDFSTPSYLSSVQNITWNSQTWLASSMDVQLGDAPTLRFFNEATSLGQIILSDGVAGRAVEIYIGYQNDAAHPSPEQIFVGEMGEAIITDQVSIRCRRYAPLKSPRHYAVPPLCNHLPKRGTRIETPRGVVVLG